MASPKAPKAEAVCLIPLMGPFHLRFPRYNAITVLETVEAFQPDALASTALAPNALDEPRWQDTSEIALPLAIIPWARRRMLPLSGIAEPSPDPEAEADFDRYLAQYPQGRELQAELAAALRPVEALLEEALTAARIEADLLPQLETYHHLRRERFGEGPGTGWLAERCERMADALLTLDAGRIAVLAPIDHLPGLRLTLADRVALEPPPEVAESEAARVRGLLDFAMRTEVPEPGNVLTRLREVAAPEARYHEANLLLANGHPAEALERLEAASQGDFQEPYYLPGYLLARLGQLRDLAGDRDGAIRAYRGIRALDYAPADAIEAAGEGLQKPFGTGSDVG